MFIASSRSIVSLISLRLLLAYLVIISLNITDSRELLLRQIIKNSLERVLLRGLKTRSIFTIQTFIIKIKNLVEILRNIAQSRPVLTLETGVIIEKVIQKNTNMLLGFRGYFPLLFTLKIVTLKRDKVLIISLTKVLNLYINHISEILHQKLVKSLISKENKIKGLD